MTAACCFSTVRAVTSRLGRPVRLFARFASFPQLGWLVEELKQQLSAELDFRHEAANAAAMAAAFVGRPEVAVPPVFGALSGQRVLTMQWLEGCKVLRWRMRLMSATTPKP